MINAKRFDDRITIGGVPVQEDLHQLKEIGYKTLVDVRDNDEKFGHSCSPLNPPKCTL